MAVTMAVAMTVAVITVVGGMVVVEIGRGAGGGWRVSWGAQGCRWGFWKTVKVGKGWDGVFT